MEARLSNNIVLDLCCGPDMAFTPRPALPLFPLFFSIVPLPVLLCRQVQSLLCVFYTRIYWQGFFLVIFFFVVDSLFALETNPISSMCVLFCFFCFDPWLVFKGLLADAAVNSILFAEAADSSLVLTSPFCRLDFCANLPFVPLSKLHFFSSVEFNRVFQSCKGSICCL